MYILVYKNNECKVSIESNNSKSCFDILKNAFQIKNTNELKGSIGVLYLIPEQVAEVDK